MSHQMKARDSGDLRSVKICILMVSVVILFAEAQAQSGAWKRKAGMAMLGGSACVVHGQIYAVGGAGNGPGYYNLPTNERYDPLTDAWESRAPMPTPRGFLSTAVVNDTIYAIGGGYPTSTRIVEAYDPSTNTWTRKADMLSSRLGAQAVVVDGVIYNIGGNYSQHDCEAYDPRTNVWSARAPVPGSGGVLSVTACNGSVYAFGGSTYSPWGAVSTVFAYDPSTNSWTRKRDMPTPRFAFQTYLVGGKIYAIGGSHQQGSALSSVEVYDPTSDVWESKRGMPADLAWFGGAAINDRIYVIGGTSDWMTASASVWEYDPAFHTDIVGGNGSGTWTLMNSPYHIMGEITVPNGETLTVEPGVEVVFMGHYKLNVQGRLLAVGTRTDSIRFTAENTGTGWHGIRLISTPGANDTSKFAYCSFAYGKANTGVFNSLDRCGGALLISRYDKVLVTDCLFHSNMNSGDIWPTGGAAIYVQWASPTIRNSTFSNNSGTTDCAIRTDYSNILISGNVFSNNSGTHAPVVCLYNAPTISGNIITGNVTTRAGGGIFTITSHALITNNIIFGNQCFGMEGEGGGIKCWINDRPIIINNTVAYNGATHGGGLCCNENADPILMNNIIWGNASADGAQVNMMDANSDPHVVYCDVQGGKEGFGGVGAGANYNGLYEHNRDANPNFVNSALGNYRLADSSQCIGAGIDSAEVAGSWYRAPAFCFGGNRRPDPEHSRPDIGACENPLPMPLVGIDEENNGLPTEFALEQNYPNPFNPVTTIEFRIPTSEFVSLKVYDLIGREVTVLVNGQMAPGSYEVGLDASRLASGVYVYRLNAGRYIESHKMILMK